MKTKLTPFLLVVTALSVAPLSAQVPQLINYQGRVAVDGVNFDGAGAFKFALVDGGIDTTPTHTTTTGIVQVVNGFVVGVTVTDGGSGYATPPAVTVTGAGSGATATAVLAGDAVTSVTINSPGSGYTGTPSVTFGDPPPPVQSTGYVSYWSNDGTSNAGSEPTASVSLPVKKGLYSVLLGDATLANMSTVPATIFSNPDVRLRVWFDDGVNGFQLLTPDQRIAAVGYAVMAGTANTVSDGAITSEKLAPGAVSDSLTASGQGTVPSGAMLVSPGAADANLINQGYTVTNRSFKVTESSDPNTPDARRQHAEIWTGSKMIVWGGYNGAADLDTGGIYDPATDTWSTISTTGAPSARDSFSAVWTGSKMIVWGGWNGTTPLNTGGIYDPVTDTWTATTTAGAPSARASHTLIWTGSKLVVWGGDITGFSLNTGSVYDPATDSWSAITTTGAPEARHGHGAIWTGSKMIIWGGYNGSNNSNTGGMYDLDSDTWTALSNVAAPYGRSLHSTIWTGSKMIVWGGYDDSNDFLNTGGIYDPIADTWTTVITAGAPSIRRSHTAIWTGSKMIIWGGLNRSGGVGYPLNTGGVYDPVTDAWSTVEATGVPSERSLHTAVWTGTKMIVWGGV